MGCPDLIFIGKMPRYVDGERDRKADGKRWKDKKKMGHM
jgi:hypothetical protein